MTARFTCVGHLTFLGSVNQSESLCRLSPLTDVFKGCLHRVHDGISVPKWKFLYCIVSKNVILCVCPIDFYPLFDEIHCSGLVCFILLTLKKKKNLLFAS